MKMRRIVMFLMTITIIVGAGCSKGSKDSALKAFPASDMTGVITLSGVESDKNTSSDGNGSLKITATGPTVFNLYEVSGVDAENAKLVYQAKVKSQDVKGVAYLEMWCYFPNGGQYFSKGLDSPISGTTEWSTKQTPFVLKEGEKPNLVKLNLVFNGSGTVWIDDIKLLKE